MKERKVSLLLTTYNSEAVLKKTLASIEMQDYPDIEVCIADSCSTDGTLEIIKEYMSSSKHKVICESKKDSGIYEGLNNAIALSTGDLLQVMNDRLTKPDAISKIVSAIAEEEKISGDPDAVLGAHSDLVYAEDDTVVRYWHMGRGSIRGGWMPAHPTLMLKRSVYDKYGLYDTSYVCSADYEYMIRILKDGGRLGYVPEVLVSMYYGGTSNSTSGAYVNSIREAIRALKQNGVRPALWITGLRTVRVALQFAKSPLVNKKGSV